VIQSRDLDTRGGRNDLAMPGLAVTTSGQPLSELLARLTRGENDFVSMGRYPPAAARSDAAKTADPV